MSYIDRAQHPTPVIVPGGAEAGPARTDRPASAAAPRPGASEAAERKASGAIQGRPFPSVKEAIASMLGVITYPAPATMKVGGRTVVVDLAIDSLSSIAARLLADARSAVAPGEADPGAALRLRPGAGDAGPSSGAPGRAPVDRGSREAMLERFTAIDSAMGRVLDQPARLSAELRGLLPGTADR